MVDQRPQLLASERRGGWGTYANKITKITLEEESASPSPVPCSFGGSFSFFFFCFFCVYKCEATLLDLYLTGGRCVGGDKGDQAGHNLLFAAVRRVLNKRADIQSKRIRIC